ncbi:glycoside hydrolase family 99-like domain-containing protein [Pararhodobacter zhoushanensis]|uniref:glycoside hydrolase family 99-like domain-containing protein n=1 Tax=Pararhodobacter zhoushanensis TaxID=2479545 RepID=UPI000F8F01CF|nr:glycoside hydrolase family 99-like domain-containing protein [Pararhodobacter zhoushanensis]
MTPAINSVSVGIISWEGMEQAAALIAAQAAAVAADVVVIHSDRADTRPQASGRWIHVSQELFFGRKFDVLLSSIMPDKALLLIQADASCVDWGGLICRFAQVLSERPSVGLWVPRIDNTPFDVAIVADGTAEDNLIHVTQTDAIVLGITPNVVTRLGALDYSENNLGWGIDWAAIAFCARKGLEVVCDLSQRVTHPKSRSYNSDTADYQMAHFIEQLNPADRALIQRLRGTIKLQVQRRFAMSHVDMPLPFRKTDMTNPSGNEPMSLLEQVSFLLVQHGKILINLPAGQTASTLLANGERSEAIERSGSSPLPFVLDFNEDAQEGIYKTLTTGQEWSCPRQSTINFAFDPEIGPVRTELIVPLELPSTFGDLHLCFGAAVHRADVDLLIQWHDDVDDGYTEEMWIKLDPQFRGAFAVGDYQKIDVRIPDTGWPRTLRVSLCYWGRKDEEDGEPAVVLCTRPYLMPSAQMASTSSHMVVITDGEIHGQLHEIAVPPTDGDVTLIVGERAYPLLQKPPHTARLVLEEGRLVASSDAFGRYSLVINNRPTGLLWLGPEKQQLSISNDLLDNVSTRIELCDPTGNIVCASYSPMIFSKSKIHTTLEEPQVPEVLQQPDETVAPETVQSDQEHPDAWAIAEFFEQDFYLASFLSDERPKDPKSHYLTKGWKEGRDPAPWFSTWHYLSMHQDVAAAGMNPFLHYCVAGHREGRALTQLGRQPGKSVFDAQAFAVAPGPYFEEFDPTIGVGRRKRAKVLAYYLPQFHTVPVNDESWGTGFTEWRNLPRALPRFYGHIQPRIPRDLGCYDLSEGDVMRRQIAMAKAAGLFGFCFYHYWFDGERVLETPVERLIADSTLDFPFCLMWANENWTRTWDGSENEIILGQNYREEDDIPFIDDVARHMKDPRYIRVDDRPVFFIYRPGHIPNAKERLAEWRDIFRERHNLDPLIFNAQAFGDNDPRVFGLDGAIEFPPHKVLSRAPNIAGDLSLFDSNFSGDIRDYETLVSAAALSPDSADFPLIRTVFPSWDNDSRRPGRSTIIANSTPEKFAVWLDEAIRYSEINPIYGEPIVCINAWNEWAEGAYLEPDVHFGSGYLNAMSRVLHGVNRDEGVAKHTRILLVGHDTLAFGAQTLLCRIGSTLKERFGVDVTFLVIDSNTHDGSFKTTTQLMQSIGELVFLDQIGEREINGFLREQGFSFAITNTTPSGRVVPALKKAGLTVISLIHELPKLLKSYDLVTEAEAIAHEADHVIFPAEIVRDGFEGFAGTIAHKAEIFPQGLYNTRVLETPLGDDGLRAELGLGINAKIVLGVGYADLRKGIDRFVSAGLSLCSTHDDIVFLWVGAPAGEAIHWFQPEIDASGLGDRIRILGHREDIARFFAAANAFYLSSREDPFPSVVLEALAAGLPVIGHKGCGGCDALIDKHGTLVDKSDPMVLAGALLVAVSTSNSRAVNARRADIEQNYSFPEYVFGLIQRLMPDLPSVSAVVPNYKYEAYIGERLRSVFDQTMPLREVIVLDDASPDNSVAEIQRVAEAAGRKIDLHVNAKNSGSPFPQWRKGVELAQGEYVWIGEADDLAYPTFVARLIDQMRLAGSVLGFTDSNQIDENGAPLGDSYRHYINQIEPGAFDKPFDMDAPEFLARFLAVKNVILNVSGVIFHRQTLLDAFDAVGEELYSYSVAGDWCLYAEICAQQGNRVSFIPEPLNTHRRHRVSVTHALKVDKHLSEIAEMHNRVGSRISLSRDTIEKQKKHYTQCEVHLAKNG